MIKIVIKGDPIPAARPRFDGKHTYQPEKNRSYRQEVQLAATLAMRGHEPIQGPVLADVKLYRRFKPTGRKYGDVDNHLKALFDGLNGIAFVDDSQIVRCVVEKHLDCQCPRTEVILAKKA